MIKRIGSYLWNGISWGCTMFVLICLIGTLAGGELFLEPILRDFPRQALGAVLCGILCGSTAIVYTFKRLPFWVGAAIHFTIGLTGYFFLACLLGWMPVGNWRYSMAFVLIGILFFAGIWTFFYCYNRHEAKKWNERLRELEKETEEE